MNKNMMSNKSIQFLTESAELSLEKEDSISLAGGAIGRNNKNVMKYKSPDYLLNDGSLVNLESMDKSVIHDSEENLNDLECNLKKIKGMSKTNNESINSIDIKSNLIQK